MSANPMLEPYPNADFVWADRCEAKQLEMQLGSVVRAAESALPEGDADRELIVKFAAAVSRAVAAIDSQANGTGGQS